MVKGTPKLANLFSLSKTPQTARAALGNEAILAVLSSSILSPMLVPTITSYIAKLPYVATHVSIAAAIPAILLFRIGIAMENRTVGALILGVAGSFVLTAVLPFVSPILNKVQN